MPGTKAGHDDKETELLSESQLMDSLNPEHPPVTAAPAERRPLVWKFWGTALWGLFIFAAMFIGQIAVVAWFVAALWLAIHFSRTPFSDYLALRWTSWTNVAIGVAGLFVLVMGWDLLSRATGREVTPGFMVDVLKSARADGALWLLVFAFCVAAPISEELFARGFLYRGWSETFLRPAGAILLSSVVWTGLHLQYDWFFFGEVFSIGLWLGYLRHRSNSTWLTIVLHGLNNLGAVGQTIWLAG